MKEWMTISELARVMNVSVHQIRYFEEKEVLMPAYVDDNLYRMYGMQQVYQLAQILLLRQLGMSVSDIKTSIASYTPKDYEARMEKALRDTEKQIQLLQKRHRHISKIIYEQRAFEPRADKVTLIERSQAGLKRFLAFAPELTFHAGHLAAHPQLAPDLFQRDIHYIEEKNGDIGMYIEAPEAPEAPETPDSPDSPDNKFDRVLPGGTYLSLPFLAIHEREIDQRAFALYAYAEQQGYSTAGDAVLIEKSYLSLFDNDKLHYELILKLDASNDEFRLS